MVRAVDGDVAAGAPTVTPTRYVGRVLLDIHVTLDAQSTAEQDLEVAVGRAVGPVALQAIIADPAGLHRIVLKGERSPDVLVTLQARLRNGASLQHSSLLGSVRIVTVRAVHSSLVEWVVRELSRLGQLPAVT